MAIPFGATWGTLCERCEDLPDDATLITPLANARFRITDVREQRIIIENTDTGESQPLQREQFEALAQHTADAIEGFEVDRLPPKAEPYAAVLALHPRYVLDQQEGTIIELADADESAVFDSVAESPIVQFALRTDLSQEDVESLFPRPYGFSPNGLEEIFRIVSVVHPWSGFSISFHLYFGDSEMDWRTGEWLVTEGERINSSTDEQ